jgi:hypothetical protein
MLAFPNSFFSGVIWTATTGSSEHALELVPFESVVLAVAFELCLDLGSSPNSSASKVSVGDAGGDSVNRADLA